MGLSWCSLSRSTKLSSGPGMAGGRCDRWDAKVIALLTHYNSLRIRPSAGFAVTVTVAVAIATTSVDITPLTTSITPLLTAATLSRTADAVFRTDDALCTTSFPFLTTCFATFRLPCPVINLYDPPIHHPTPFTALSSTRRLIMNATTRKKNARAQKIMSLSYQSAFSSCLTRRVDVARRLEYVS